ncbi:MAG: thiamine diphosphokinase [Enterococcus sp.]
MDVLIVAGGKPETWPPLGNFDYYVGVDRGAWYLLQRECPLDLAIGDFDSLTPTELNRVQNSAQKMASAPPEKDDTDTQLALQEVFRKHPTANVTLIGATGGRLDHLLANLWVALEPRFTPYIRQIRIADWQNQVDFFAPGSYQLKQHAPMKYLAFCCLTAVDALSISGAKYSLTKKDVLVPTSYASNEFVAHSVAFSFTKGVLAVIQSRDIDELGR